jgi:hypothetical protein
MKENLHVVIITVLLFGAGLFTGVWTQRVKPAPPPPVPFMGEFGGARGHGGEGERALPSPERAREMREQMEAQRPQIEAFQAKMEAIEKAFRARLEAILKPEQKARFAQVLPHPGGPQGAPPEGPGRGEPPMGGPQGPREGPGMAGPGHGPAGGPGGPGFMGWVVYKPALERLSSELGLDAKQKAQAEELFKQRRAELLNLVDTAPPPSAVPPGGREGAGAPPRR